MTIEAVVSVITQHKHCIRWYSNWPKLIFSIFVSVWLVLQISIDVQLPSLHFNFIALQDMIGEKQLELT